MSDSGFSHDSLRRLAERLLTGEVVFFIGAGFSLDSERNTATRLLKRLFARFEALTTFMREGSRTGNADDLAPRAEVKLQAERIVDGLVTIFRDRDQVWAWRDDLSRLAADYYRINDWICSAYGELLDGVVTLCLGADGKLDSGKANRIAACLNERENAVLAEKPVDPEKLEPMKLVCLSRLGARHRGKALFLDTLGFANQRIMGGSPTKARLVNVEQSYAGRILLRHSVLARLAREGLCPILLTTNYDLLLEGAYRLAGFAPSLAEQDTKLPGPVDRLPLTGIPRYSRVSDATQFFNQGAAHRSALVVKIHGCVDAYRASRPTGPLTESCADLSRPCGCHSEDRDHEPRPCAGVSPWAACLPSMVFTYREIQNWREDSWSRDLLHTLLRTRTIVFAGYSGQDPVLHDTFRNVYEEMARHRQALPKVRGKPEDCSEMAPAFFLGVSDSMEFHAMEILRSASRAVGLNRAPLTKHSNYLKFHRAKGGRVPFPGLDETLGWLFHCVLRLQQKRALETSLRRLTMQIFRKPRPVCELATIRDGFERIWRHEQEAANLWREGPSARRSYQQISGWSQHFHPCLLREFACAETVLENQGPGPELAELRSEHWYYPASDNPAWTAWALVIELALRKMLATWQGRAGEWAESSRLLEPARAKVPTILFAHPQDQFTPASLSLRYEGFDRPGRPAAVRGAVTRDVCWGIPLIRAPREDIPEAVVRPPPEPREGSPKAFVRRTPDAATLWSWAASLETSLDKLGPHLGARRD